MFPNIDINKLDDDEFARIANEADYLVKKIFIDPNRVTANSLTSGAKKDN